MKKDDAARLLSLIGWKPFGARPEPKRFVLIAAPHTSNWDLPITLLLASYFEVDISWMGKHTLFEPPLGWLMTRLGGIPVDRRAKHDMVKSSAELLNSREELALMVPAEGTRSRAEYWKSGFYWIAREAGVPIVLGLLDYGRKEGGFGPAILPTGDVRADMDKIREFYAGRVGLYPDNFGPVRLKDETARPAGA